MSRVSFLVSLSFVVALAPAGRAEEPEAASLERLFTRSRTWVWAKPGAARRLGYVRGGQVLTVAGEPVRGRGCSGPYVPIEPRGYVCHDGGDTTTDPMDRAYRVARLLAPSPSAHLFDYVISNGVPLYRRLPSPEEWTHVERDLGRPGSYKKYPWNEKHERLAEERLVNPDDSLPFFLLDGGSARSEHEGELLRMIAPLGTMLGYVRAFSHAGRTWLLMTDGTVAPADRVRPYRRSSFRGVVLTEDTSLPIAWARRDGTPVWTRVGDEDWATEGTTLSVRERVELDGDGQEEKIRGRHVVLLAGTAAEPRYVGVDDLFVARRRPMPSSVGAGDRWVHVSIEGGTLVAYEGTRPVFATLIAPGAGGVDREGVDPVKASTTPRGRYRIQYKYRSQTMSPQKDKPETERTFWIAEVPFAQYFRIPFALHGAYWHDDFGTPMSGGCVNLSPRDAMWLFDFTRPVLPAGWEAAWAGGDNGRGSFVLVTR